MTINLECKYMTVEEKKDELIELLEKCYPDSETIDHVKFVCGDNNFTSEAIDELIYEGSIELNCNELRIV